MAKQQENTPKILDRETLEQKISHFVKNDKKKVKISFFSYMFTVRALVIMILASLVAYKVYDAKINILFINYTWGAYIVVMLALFYIYKKYKFSGMTKKYKLIYRNRNTFIVSKHLIVFLRKYFLKRKENVS